MITGRVLGNKLKDTPPTVSWLWLTSPSWWAEADDPFQKQLWRNVPRLIITEEKHETTVSKNHGCSMAVDALLLCPHYWCLSHVYRTVCPVGAPWRTSIYLIIFHFSGVSHWGQEQKGATKDEMAGWHQWPSGREFEQTPGDSEGWGSLICCSPWSHKELDTTWMNNKINICLINKKWKIKLDV